MDRHEFQAQILDTTFEEIKRLNTTKGHDYAGDSDALANFKSASERIGLTSQQVWAVYADKHWSAIMTFCKEGDVKSEPIEGRIDDAILYLLLLKGLIKESNSEPARPDLPAIFSKGGFISGGGA